MRFGVGDLVVHVGRQGLGRVLSAKRSHNLCRVKWSAHCTTDCAKDSLAKTGSRVTSKDGVTGTVIALSASGVKVMQSNYETAWLQLTDLVPRSENCPGVPAKATEVAGRSQSVFEGIDLKDNGFHSGEQTCKSLLGGQEREHGRMPRGATR